MTKTIGMIAGSWKGEELQELLDNVFLVEKPHNIWGSLLPHYVGTKGDATFVFMQRHGDNHGEPIVTPAELVNQDFSHSYEAIISELTDVNNAEAVFGFSRVGVFDKARKNGSLWQKEWPLAGKGYFVVLNDNFPYRDVPLTFGSDIVYRSGSKVKHPSMIPAYDPTLQKSLERAVNDAGGTPLMGGLYIYTLGNNFEHYAETRVIDRLTKGFAPFRVVGMTTYPELKLLKEKDVHYASLTLPVNPAAHLAGKKGVSHDVTNEESRKAKELHTNVLKNLIDQYA